MKAKPEIRRTVRKVTALAGALTLSAVTFGDTIPADYEQIEYIQSSGKQWIDTQLSPTYSTKVELDLAYTDPGEVGVNGVRMFGIHVNNYIRIQLFGNGNIASFCTRLGSGGATANTHYNQLNIAPGTGNNTHRSLLTLELNDSSSTFTYLDKETDTSSTKTGTFTKSGSDLSASMYLFTTRTAADTSAPVVLSKMKFYAGKITQSGVVQREFVPVRQVSSGKAGLLDLVAYSQDSTTGFYKSKGTDDFAAGETTGYVYASGKCYRRIANGDTVACGTEYNDNVQFDADATVTLSGTLGAETPALTVAGSRETVLKGNLTFVLPDTVTAGTYTLVSAEDGITVPQGTLVRAVHSAGEFVECFVTVGETAITLQVKCLPVTATWTNATGDGDPANSENWACTNYFGEALASTLPTSATVVTLSNGCTNDFPAGKPLAVKEVKLPATLGADNLDWCGIIAPLSGTLDLQGRSLTLSCLTGTAAITDSTDSVGELHVSVPAGTTNANATVALTGSLKLVKEGAGAFTAAKTGQTYSGGTKVAAGLLSLPAGNTGATGCLGAVSGAIRVEKGATLELNGNIHFDAYPLVLAGGELMNSSGESTYDKQTAVLGRVTLEADSTITPKVSIAHTGLVDLNEHTLTVGLPSGQGYTLKGSANFTNGTVVIASGGWFRALDNSRDMRTVNMSIKSGVFLNYDILVNDLALLRTDNSAGGSGGFRIYGTFKTKDAYIYHRNCEMQDGSALDLSAATSVWALEPYSTFSNCNPLKFAKNATVTVLLGNRKLKENEQIISWLSANTPDTTVKFVLEPDKRAGLIRKTEGLRVKKGLLIRIR